MFEIGEYVIYGSKGVCQIKDIAPVDLPNAEKGRPYYIMNQVQNGKSTVYSPVDNQKIPMRRIMTEAEAHKLIEEIPVIERLFVSDEKKRELSYKEALRNGDCRSWVSVIKTLYFRQKERIAAGKKITALDERYLKAAELELYGELSVVLGVSKNEMENYIHTQLESAG